MNWRLEFLFRVLKSIRFAASHQVLRFAGSGKCEIGALACTRSRLLHRGHLWGRWRYFPSSCSFYSKSNDFLQMPQKQANWAPWLQVVATTSSSTCSTPLRRCPVAGCLSELNDYLQSRKPDTKCRYAQAILLAFLYSTLTFWGDSRGTF